MAETYTTIQGETWDNIAYKVYGAEKYASFLMEVFEYFSIFIRNSVTYSGLAREADRRASAVER